MKDVECRDCSHFSCHMYMEPGLGGQHICDGGCEINCQKVDPDDDEELLHRDCEEFVSKRNWLWYIFLQLKRIARFKKYGYEG